jgi:hypothetical protein
MPQTPLTVIKNGTMITGAGSSSALNVSAAAVIKAAPGRIVKIIILGVVGTGGALTINDCATVGAATAANQVFTWTTTFPAVGTIMTLDFPCQVGIVISSVFTGGTPLYAISYV